MHLVSSYFMHFSSFLFLIVTKKLEFFYIHLSYSLNFIFVCHCHIMGGGHTSA